MRVSQKLVIAVSFLSGGGEVNTGDRWGAQRLAGMSAIPHWTHCLISVCISETQKCTTNLEEFAFLVLSEPRVLHARDLFVGNLVLEHSGQ